MSELRFDCLMEPTETWVVWDKYTDQPAVEPALLVGLSKEAAKAACRTLNQRHLSDPETNVTSTQRVLISRVGTPPRSREDNQHVSVTFFLPFQNSHARDCTVRICRLGAICGAVIPPSLLVFAA